MNIHNVIQQKLHLPLAATLLLVLAFTHYRVIIQYAQEFDTTDFMKVTTGTYTYHREAGSSLYPHCSMQLEMIALGLVEQLELDTFTVYGDCSSLFEKYKKYDFFEKNLRNQCVIKYVDTILEPPDSNDHRLIRMENKGGYTSLDMIRTKTSLFFYIK